MILPVSKFFADLLCTGNAPGYAPKQEGFAGFGRSCAQNFRFKISNLKFLRSHILILQRNAQLPGFGSLDHRLEVVNFFCSNPNQVIVNRSLYL